MKGRMVGGWYLKELVTCISPVLFPTLPRLDDLFGEGRKEPDYYLFLRLLLHTPFIR